MFINQFFPLTVIFICSLLILLSYLVVVVVVVVVVVGGGGGGTGTGTGGGGGGERGYLICLVFIKREIDG